MEKTPERIGKYKLIREVGRGATATVYLAEHPQYPENVALKLIRFDDKSKDTAKWNRRLLKLLRAEMDVSCRLDHPNIIKFDVRRDGQLAVELMAYELEQRYADVGAKTKIIIAKKEILNAV